MAQKKVIPKVDTAAAEKTHGAKRSSHWPAIRKAHLKLHPNCELCGGNKKVEAHHVKPFHMHPELELDLSNLITLCEGNKDVNCHLVAGHLFSFRSFNADVREQVAAFRAEVLKRPK